MSQITENLKKVKWEAELVRLQIELLEHENAGAEGFHEKNQHSLMHDQAARLRFASMALNSQCGLAIGGGGGGGAKRKDFVEGLLSGF